MKQRSRTPIQNSLLVLILWCSFSPLAVATTANELTNHPSPYLALHANDPVSWRVWSPASLSAANQTGRLIFVSIGYYSCHWCHVMQRESYQNEDIAAALNRSYISIKVDRELQPALDQQLIDFVEQVRGTAGWPLNVFLTPEGYPLTGFTYLPPGDFLSVLQQLETQWQENHGRLSHAARSFFLEQIQGNVEESTIATNFPTDQIITAFVSQSMLVADELQGGFGTTSKFPNVPQLEALLAIIERNPGLDSEVTDFMHLTLSVMASSHLHDHVNGGFFRYTTDPDWQTPHYEKMLYDNAQLATLYLKAHRLWPDRGYLQVGLRTLDFIESSLRHEQGGYMSSLSAVDINDVEGGGYFWSLKLLEKYLDADEIEYLSKIWDLETNDSEFLAEPLIGLGATGDTEKNVDILSKLQQRGMAETPIDDKRLASWNALMLDSLTLAADFDERYADRAKGLFQNVQIQFFNNGQLLRLAEHASVADPVLEDYAQLAYAMHRYAQRFDDEDAMTLAKQLTEVAFRQFLIDGRWRSKVKPSLPVVQENWIIPDDVLVSPMSRLMLVAHEAPGINEATREMASQMLLRITRELLDSPYFYGSFITLQRSSPG